MDTLQPERPAIPAHWPETSSQRALSGQQGTHFCVDVSLIKLTLN